MLDRDQQRDRLEVDRVDQLRRVQQLGHGDHARQRGRLQHRDRLVAGRRDDHAHRLRQHDPAHRLHARHAQRLRRVGLALVDRDDPGADDLGHVGALVQARARESPARNAVISVFAFGCTNAGPNGMPSESLGVQSGDVVPEQQLHEHRRAAEEPDVEPARAREQRVRREPHDREHHAEHDPDRHRDHRQLDRHHQAREDAVVEQVFADDAPLKPGLVTTERTSAAAITSDDRRGDPAARAADRDGPDVIGPPGRAGDLGRGHQLPLSSSRR